MDYPKDSEPMRCSIPIDNFIAIAMNTWYDPYEWSIQIPMSLRIYGNERSFLIEVHEYDCRQNLSYVNMELTEPVESRIIKSLMVEDGDYDYKPIWADEN